MLDCEGFIGRCGYFKFENMWSKNEGFVEKVRLWWSSYNFSGILGFVLASNLKALKVDLHK